MLTILRMQYWTLEAIAVVASIIIRNTEYKEANNQSIRPELQRIVGSRNEYLIQ